jgi:hypothetical protein
VPVPIELAGSDRWPLLPPETDGVDDDLDRVWDDRRREALEEVQRRW